MTFPSVEAPAVVPHIGEEKTNERQPFLVSALIANVFLKVNGYCSLAVYVHAESGCTDEVAVSSWQLVHQGDVKLVR